jgi:hypothetical protein
MCTCMYMAFICIIMTFVCVHVCTWILHEHVHVIVKAMYMYKTCVHNHPFNTELLDFQTGSLGGEGVGGARGVTRKPHNN